MKIKKMKIGTELNTYDKTVSSFFAGIVKCYDPLNRVLSFGLDAWWRKRLVDSIRTNQDLRSGIVLDMAAGTLEVTVGILRRYPETQVVAVDFCRPMLVHGLPKIKDYAPNRVIPLVGDARNIPLCDGSVDVVTMAFGLRNVKPRPMALAEALRVLVPGGKLCILEFGSAQEKILFGVYNVYLRYVLPFLGKILSRKHGAYEHLASSIADFPKAESLKEEMLAVGFEKVKYKKLSAGIVCIHMATKG